MTTAVVQVRDGASGSFRDLTTVSTDARGVFTKSVAYAKGRQYQLVWTAPDGTRYAGGGVRAYAL